MVNHSKISVGEKVYFLVYKFDAKNERKKLYKKGIVVARYDNILHIESRKKTYKIEQAKVGEFKHEVRQFQKPYDNQQAEQISLMV